MKKDNLDTRMRVAAWIIDAGLSVSEKIDWILGDNDDEVIIRQDGEIMSFKIPADITVKEALVLSGQIHSAKEYNARQLLTLVLNASIKFNGSEVTAVAPFEAEPNEPSVSLTFSENTKVIDLIAMWSQKSAELWAQIPWED
jgi:hypothetical protein